MSSVHKQDLVTFMNSMGFDIADIGCINGHEIVAKKCHDGELVWWPMEIEGSGFERLFKGHIRSVCKPC
jgi:hypothetical protein